MTTGRTLTIVLPFAPEEREAHEQLVAGACALQAQGGWAELQVLQLTPVAGAIAPVGGNAALHWWEVVNPHAGAEADADTLARLVAAALPPAACRLIVWPAGPVSEEAAALLAADLGAAVLGRCTALALEGSCVTARRAAFGGRLELDLRSEALACCAVWRPRGPVRELAPLAPDQVHHAAVDIEAPAACEVELLESADGQARLEGARLVVSGGRGMAGREGFELLGRIAGQLGAAVAGSLPAVDAGWVPVARQVGQSGRFVAPRLYFAVGISGTPQHLAGIATGTRMIAVNSDPEAPIFAVADVGVVADWQELLPPLARRLESAGG